jgi:hypothetical protein
MNLVRALDELEPFRPGARVVVEATVNLARDNNRQRPHPTQVRPRTARIYTV